MTSASDRPSRDGVHDLRWEPGNRHISWLDHDALVHKTTELPPHSVVRLRTGDGVVVVEAYVRGKSNDLVIYDSDGDERWRIGLPPLRGAKAIDQAYYVGEDLTAVIATITGDVAVVLDPASGQWIRQYETR